SDSIVLDSGLHLVLAPDDRNVVSIVLGSGRLKRWRKPARSERAKTVDIDSGKPAVARNLGNSLNAILRRQAHSIVVGDLTAVVVMVNADACFVHKCGRKEMCLAESEQVNRLEIDKIGLQGRAQFGGEWLG